MTPLLEREGALLSAERFLDLVPQGPTALAIEGQPGMGKTSVWLEAVAAADRRGHLTLQARPAESEASLAYAGVTDLVGGVFDDVVGTLPAPQAAALAAALLRTEASRPIELRAVATAVGSVLAHLARAQPVVVAVDDLQWLDPASARVLAFVARRMGGGVGLLVAERRLSGVRRSQLTGSLPEEVLQRTVLHRLSVGALDALLEDRFGLSLPRSVLMRVSAASGGNPMFAQEIGRALSRRPRERWLDPLPVPATLQRMVATRVDALPTATREALLVAAALSRPTTTALAEALGGAATEAALAEAVRAQVVVIDHERVRFTHPLLASAVYATATVSRRRALHRRLAEVVDDQDERARHLSLSAQHQDAGIAAELEVAAARAGRRGAQDTAAELFDASCRLTPDDEVEHRARRTLDRAGALDAAGDAGSARTAAERALASTHDPAVRTSALLLLASIAWFDGDAQTATRWAGETLQVPEQDRVAQGSVHARLVRLSFSLDLRSALDHADRALSLLGADRPDLRAQVLIDQLFGRALRGEPVREGLLDEALELEARSPDDQAMPQPMPLLWYQCTDDLARARTRFSREERWHRERGEDVWVADRLSHLAIAELHAGDVSAATRHVEEACAGMEGLQVAGPRAMVFQKQAMVDAHLGRLARARATTLRLLAEHERTGQDWWAALTLSTLGFVEYAAGDHAAADTALRGMRERAARIGAVDVLFDRSEPFHIEALLELGDVDGARVTLSRLEERGRRLPRPWVTAALPRSRALVMAADGDVEAALAELAEGADAGESPAAPPLPFEDASTLLVRGRLERRAKRKRAAADTLAAAVDLFVRLDAPVFADRARQELARVGLRPSGTDLTATELLVARLASDGMTNREVARAAFVSPKTVEANLARVYRKLGIRSRAELGARMAPPPPRP